jgi:hypothetical protein
MLDVHVTALGAVALYTTPKRATSQTWDFDTRARRPRRKTSPAHGLQPQESRPRGRLRKSMPPSPSATRMRLRGRFPRGPHPPSVQEPGAATPVCHASLANGAADAPSGDYCQWGHAGSLSGPTGGGRSITGKLV